MLEVTECPKCRVKVDRPFTKCPSCGVHAEAYLGVMRKQKELASGNVANAPFHPQGNSIQTILNRFVGDKVGINYDDATKSKPAELSAAGVDHFSVTPANSDLVYHFPYTNVLSLTEGKTTNIKSGVVFGFEAALFICVYHQVVYKGAVGFGMRLPLGGDEQETAT